MMENSLNGIILGPGLIWIGLVSYLMNISLMLPDGVGLLLYWHINFEITWKFNIIIVCILCFLSMIQSVNSIETRNICGEK